MMKAILTLAILLCLTPNLWAESFGYSSAGQYPTSIEDIIWANRSSPAKSGTLDSIKAWVVTTTANRNVKFAVYKWSDTSFVDSTEIVTTQLATEWLYADFVGNASIYADTEYALCVIAEAADGDCQVFFNTSGGAHAAQSPFTYGVWPTPKWTTVTHSGVYEFSILCFYTAEEAVAGQIFILQH